MTTSSSLETLGVIIATVSHVDANGAPCVSWAESDPIAARVVWIASAPKWSDFIGARVVVGFLGGDETQPIVLGLLDAPPAVQPRDPDVLRIASGRELTIECGQAKIMLRADGRVEVRGTHLVSRSSGPNKIKGGTVHIN